MIYFIIPFYNEVANLERLINETTSIMTKSKQSFQLVLVNDGSTDNSLEVIESMQKNNTDLVVLSHYPNKGVKDTFIEGFQYFIKNAEEGDIVITKEADNTSDPNLTLKMIDEIKNNDYDIVLASCYMHDGGFDNTNFIRKLMSFTANTMIKIRFNLWHLHTFSSFYRAFSYKAISTGFDKYSTEIMTRNGFSCVVEMLIKLNAMNFRIKEIPMILKSSERKGKSKMPILKTIMGYFKLCLQKM